MVNIDSAKAPGARIHNAALELLESGGSGNRWLSIKAAIDWTPEKKDQWVQVTFDLISDKSSTGGTAAARIGYYIALNDFDDSGSAQGGNILIDGNPAGGAAVHSDYPGNDSKNIGSIGKSGYRSGGNYGVRDAVNHRHGIALGVGDVDEVLLLVNVDRPRRRLHDDGGHEVAGLGIDYADGIGEGVRDVDEACLVVDGDR